jgi:hypothetical protein
MKLFTFTITLLLLSLASFTQTNTCASYFRRNNGNGACKDGQLRLYFAQCPAVAPLIDSVYTNGVKAQIVFGEPDMSKCSSLGYVAYCVTGGNMPPASLWQIFFHSAGSVDPFSCMVTEGSVLPIGLKSFGATRNGATVSLNWQTAYESNAQSIEIQKRSGSGFVTVGSVTATNNLNGHAYNFVDRNTSASVTEYRLRLLSKDADAAFSEIRTVKGVGATLDFTVFPNPAVRNAKISITDVSEPTDLQVVDNVGRVVKSIILQNANTVELNNLQVGIYRIRLTNKISGVAITKTLSVTQ